jgi:hypothetical protein
MLREFKLEGLFCLIDGLGFGAKGAWPAWRHLKEALIN